MTLDGYWVDIKYLFVRKYEVKETLFYKNLSFDYKHRQPARIPRPYNQASLDAPFSETIVGEVPYPLRTASSEVPTS